MDDSSDDMYLDWFQGQTRQSLEPCGIPDPVPTVQCTRAPLSGFCVFPPFLTVRYNQQVDAKRDLERPSD